MKNILLLSFISILLVACSVDNKSKAIDLVEKQISDQVIDGFQYSFLDSLFTSVHHNETYIANSKKLSEARSKLTKARQDSIDEVRYTGNSGMFDGLIKLYSESVDEYEEKERILNEKFMSEFAGYKLYQAYKYKTSFGDSIKVVRYDFNKELTKITETYPMQMGIELEKEVYKNGSVFSDNIKEDMKRLAGIEEEPTAVFFYLEEGGDFEDYF